MSGKKDQVVDSGKPLESEEGQLAEENPRDAAMKAILESRGQPITIMDDDPLSDDEKLLAPDYEDAAALENTPEPAIDNVSQEEDEPFLTLKVNGEEVSLSKDEALSRLQKAENADRRTQEAVLLKRQYEQRLTELENQPKPSIQQDDELDESQLKTQLAQAVEKVYDGELEEGAETLAKVIAKRGQSTTSEGLTAEDVRGIVSEVTTTNSIKDSFQRFKQNDKYQHLLSDPYLMQKVDDATVILQEDAEFMSTNPTYDDIFERAGEMTQGWLDGLAKGSQADDPMQERVERKRASPKPVQSRSATRPTQREEKPKTRDDILAEMANRRGQNFVS